MVKYGLRVLLIRLHSGTARFIYFSMKIFSTALVLGCECANLEDLREKNDKYHR